jgi:pimeloyl-ACP methyl ester carboxylesterase
MAFLTQPPPTSQDKFIARFSQISTMVRVGRFPVDEDKDFDLAERIFARGFNPDGTLRHLQVALNSGNRKPRLASVKAPTLVIHGAIDPLIPIEHGRDTAASIPGARLLMIEGMGHAIPSPMRPLVVREIAMHAQKA